MTGFQNMLTVFATLSCNISDLVLVLLHAGQMCFIVNIFKWLPLIHMNFLVVDFVTFHQFATAPQSRDMFHLFVDEFWYISCLLISKPCFCNST